MRIYRRYREIYYWDSFWILEGLLRSELNSYAHDLLANFMDMVELYGFLPNGGRKYYLNRSQPPVFTMVSLMAVLYTHRERAQPDEWSRSFGIDGQLLRPGHWQHVGPREGLAHSRSQSKVSLKSMIFMLTLCP